MKRIFPRLALVLVLLSVPSLAAALEVEEGVITTQVSDRAPVDAVESYSATVEKLYCFTRITGAEEDTAIYHVWKRNGEEMARVELGVRSSDWRTWSSKNLLPEWTGEWTVEVLDTQGNLLATIPFSLI